MSHRARSASTGWIATAVVAAVSALLARPACAQFVLYTGTMRTIVKTGQVPQSPPAASIPTYGGVLKLTPGKGITIFPGDANFATSFVVSNPPTFAGVLQQTSFLTVMNPMTATARPGNGPGPFTFAFPFPTGSPPVNPTLGVSKRLGAASAAGGGNNFGGTFPFLFNFVAHLVYFGGGGGQPNLACPLAIPGSWGASFVAATAVTCVGITTGPLPAITLPSIMVPQHVTETGWQATTRGVFAGAPAPITTTTLTETGSDVRNAAGTSGMIQLVAPFLYHSQLGGPANPLGQLQGAGVAEFTLTLMPEPGPGLALFGGIAALSALRFTERRRAIRRSR